MRDRAIFVKTEAGRAEIGTRARKLAPGLRSVLLLVDGHRDAGQLRLVAEKLHAPEDALETLARLGLISEASASGTAAGGPEPDPVGAEEATWGDSEVARRFRALSGLMSEAVGQHLGLRGYFVQLKIERCSTVEELAALLRGDLHAALAKAKSADFADRWVEGVEAAGLL